MTHEPTAKAFLLVGALLSVLFLYSLALDDSSRRSLLGEGGLVESATAAFYILCIAFIVGVGKAAYARRHPDLLLLVVFFLLRELDFDKKFTAVGLLKARFFLSDSVPLGEKAIGAVLLLILAAIGMSIIYRYSKRFWSGLRDRSIVSMGALLSIGLLGVSQVLDGLPRKLKSLGFDPSHSAFLHTTAMEEILELGIPLILLLTFNAYFRRSSVISMLRTAPPSNGG